MAQILVRDIEDVVKERLQQRATRHGRSMEAEVRDILRDAARHEEPRGEGLGRELAELFQGIGLTMEETIPELRGHGLPDPFDS